MPASKWIAVAALGAALSVFAAGALAGLQGAVPTDLGVRDGRLKAPSTTPNSVSSQAGLHTDHPRRVDAAIAPLALVDGDGPRTIARLAAVVRGMPGAEIVTAEPDYLRVQFTSRWLRFVDDAEFWFDPAAGVVQVRSASRIGYSDLGVNRARIEAVRARLAGG